MTHHHALMGDDVSGADGAPVGDEIAAPETVEPEGQGSIVDSVRQGADELAEGWDRMRGTIGPFSVGDPTGRDACRKLPRRRPPSSLKLPGGADGTTRREGGHRHRGRIGYRSGDRAGV